MYRNLKAEMARNRVSKKDLAKCIGVTFITIVDKLNGEKRFYYDEACMIKQKFFPKLELEYLFENEEKTEIEKDGILSNC